MTTKASDLVNRQESIIDYMATKDLFAGYTPREIATFYNVTPNAVLKGFKRLRARGRVFKVGEKGTGTWYLTTSERSRHNADESLNTRVTCLQHGIKNPCFLCQQTVDG